MLSSDIIKKIKKIELYTKRLLRGSLAGNYNSIYKGSGFEFDKIREYQSGDDVRFIDWNSSSKSNSLLVKQYIEERSRTIIIAVDVSASGFFSSTAASKYDVIAQVAAIFALVASFSKDSVSLVLFSDEIEFVVPAKSGPAHIHYIMQKLFEYKAKKKLTNIASVFKYLAKLRKKDAMVILLSDFIDNQSYDKYMSVVSKIYDLIVIRCLDKNENTLPNVGLLSIKDFETGNLIVIDTSQQKSIDDFLLRRKEKQSLLFKKYGIDCLDFNTSDPFIDDIVLFFRKRMMR